MQPYPIIRNPHGIQRLKMFTSEKIFKKWHTNTNQQKARTAILISDKQILEQEDYQK